ncbi:MAG: hypothetical protein WC688_07175 [Parachlamydiales bacterium]
MVRKIGEKVFVGSEEDGKKIYLNPDIMLIDERVTSFRDPIDLSNDSEDKIIDRIDCQNKRRAALVESRKRIQSFKRKAGIIQLFMLSQLLNSNPELSN